MVRQGRGQVDLLHVDGAEHLIERDRVDRTPDFCHYVALVEDHSLQSILRRQGSDLLGEIDRVDGLGGGVHKGGLGLHVGTGQFSTRMACFYSEDLKNASRPYILNSGILLNT